MPHCHAFTRAVWPALAVALVGSLGLTAPVTAQPAPARGPDRAHVDVLFIGAHPDDEFQSLATFGQWHEYQGKKIAVATITRGEGGGNAAGPEKGAALGMIREREERRAVRLAGIDDVYYLDKPDFWYTLSAPLVSSVWDPSKRPDTLERLVRLIRATTPDTVVVMDPRPYNQHGAHQLSARLGIEAFFLADNPRSFPRQLTRERYPLHQPQRLLAQDWVYEPDATQQDCARHPDDVTGLPKEGHWTGTWSARNRTTWAQVERNAARLYVTQGFDRLFSSTVDKLRCDWYTVLAEHGRRVTGGTGSPQSLRPLYAEFRTWANDHGMPWLANEAQPEYPVPAPTTIPAVRHAPTLDGIAGDGEYPGDTLVLRHWDGVRCTPSDCAAAARLSRHDGDLYVFVKVVDDLPGGSLKSTDCERHWRTDAVEIALDPKGVSDDTASTYKLAVLPTTSDDGPCAARDADNHQGLAARTSPGAAWAARFDPQRSVNNNYAVEVRIPLVDLPDSVDPGAMTANIMVYDSDTDDYVGHSRLAWSTFGSAQADPYVWVPARLPGYQPPVGKLPTPPTIPVEAALSKDSPPSRLQRLRTGVPLGVGPRLR